MLEYCGRGTLDALLHHSTSLTPRAQHAQHGQHGGNGNGSGSGGRPPPELQKLLPLLRGIARGLLHLHTRRPAILHRDLKPGGWRQSFPLQLILGL